MKNDWYCLQLVDESESRAGSRQIDAAGRWYEAGGEYPLLVWLYSDDVEDALRKIRSSRGGVMEVGRASRAEFTLGANAVLFDEVLHAGALEPGLDLNPYRLSADEVKFFRLCGLFASLEDHIDTDSSLLTACVAEFMSQLAERYPLDTFDSACGYVAGARGIGIYARFLDRRIVPDSVLSRDRVSKGFEFARSQLQFQA